MVKNVSFVFLKPHANTENGRNVVRDHLQGKKLKITKEGSIQGKDISESQLIDKHYYAIASKATLVKPKDLNVPKAMFKDKFGAEWDDTLAANKIFNAKDACTELDITSDELDQHWAKSKAAKKLVKFGGGFYCGLVDTVEGKEPLYVMNGFFMAMREKYVAEGVSIYYYVVEWDAKELSWGDFRGKVLGPTDPVTAPEDSLRGMFYKNWEEYGLGAEPNVGDNAVHASASPFEGLCERMNWLGWKTNADMFGKEALKAVNQGTIDNWAKDPAVTYGPVPMKKSIFDSLEDTDADYCLALMSMIYHQMRCNTWGGLEKENNKLRAKITELKSLTATVETFIKQGTRRATGAGRVTDGGKGSNQKGSPRMSKDGYSNGRYMNVSSGGKDNGYGYNGGFNKPSYSGGYDVPMKGGFAPMRRKGKGKGKGDKGKGKFGAPVPQYYGGY